MVLPIEIQIPIAVGFGVLLLVLGAERLHGRRCRAVARLATGPTGRPRRWVGAVPFIKAASLGSMAWAVTTLIYASGGIFSPRESAEDRREHGRHVVFVADLSPSMLLEDAGPNGDKTRAQRAHEVVDGILRRLESDVVYSVIGFYTDALKVVVDAQDAELVRNVFDAALKGNYEFLDGVVLSHQCDSIDRTYDVWSYNLEFDYWHFVNYPHVSDEPSVRFTNDILRIFVRSLEKYTGKAITDQAISEAVGAHSENRRAMRASRPPMPSRCQSRSAR